MRNNALQIAAFLGLILIAAGYSAGALPIDLAFFFASTIAIVTFGAQLMRRSHMGFFAAVKDMVKGPQTREVPGSRLAFAATVLFAIGISVQTLVIA